MRRCRRRSRRRKRGSSSWRYKKRLRTKNTDNSCSRKTRSSKRSKRKRLSKKQLKINCSNSSRSRRRKDKDKRKSSRISGWSFREKSTTRCKDRRSKRKSKSVTSNFIFLPPPRPCSACTCSPALCRCLFLGALADALPAAANAAKLTFSLPALLKPHQKSQKLEMQQSELEHRQNK